ncbi:hypothetical protein [Acetanaerobacterium elongatum]|uniref:Uncharacterized protein n=1 Tax=Acetanaerobacterium elongatum TaxID=258515 RepID=A0A1H0H648_9FIRM|nr:hypothetical protein [Acetanaerobacterium elongatum]SDO14607.1 hypothetical protein SAMN05192585_1622 [Acetanaerobacterium elongatum]
MTVLLKITGILSVALLACTILCGLWLRFHPVEDKSFHFQLSLVSVIVAFITMVLFLVNIFRQ